MDMSHLLTPAAFAEFAQARRRSHGTDHEVYDDLLAAFRAKYRAEHIEGDGRFSAGRRSRRMEKHAKKLVKAAKAQYEALEALQVAHVDHVAHVTALPEQRRAKALAKTQRNTAIGEMASKSLHKTAHVLTSKDTPQDVDGQTAIEAAELPASLVDLRKKRGVA